MCELHGKKPVRDLREWFLFKNWQILQQV
jgi:hypothetical protein